MDAMEHRMSKAVKRFALLVVFASGGCVWTLPCSFRPRKEATMGLDSALLFILQRGRRRAARHRLSVRCGHGQV
eukprot:scaffold38150_cov65-Phaeocystis_antarctica.AAC.21